MSLFDENSDVIAPIAKTLLFLTILASLGLLYFATWAAVTLVGLAHDVPNPWTVSDFSLIGLPVSILAVALAATVALLRGWLLPLWICLGLFAFDVIVLVATFE